MTGRAPVVAVEPSLGRIARAGTWDELSKGTFRAATGHLDAGRGEEAAQLVEVSLLEAQELREIYEQWPAEIERWVRDRAGAPERVDGALSRLTSLIGADAAAGIEAAWPRYADSAARAARLCRTGSTADAVAAVEATRATWQDIHDQAVDRVAGMIDLAVRACGEEHLGALWDFLMQDWYEVHARRYALANQPWAASAHQLMTAIVDGFHAHLTGAGRHGDIELVEETDRIGFRFAPCGSGGRSLDPGITGGQPRSAPPFDWAVTTEPHDWAWNSVGVCSYCVHCCLLNVVMPIDRLGYPTRVVEPPVWPAAREDPACTWWVYRHPSLVPDAVYHQVGRTPDRRPPREEP